MENSMRVIASIRLIRHDRISLRVCSRENLFPSRFVNWVWIVGRAYSKCCREEVNSPLNCRDAEFRSITHTKKVCPLRFLDCPLELTEPQIENGIPSKR